MMHRLLSRPRLRALWTVIVALWCAALGAAPAASEPMAAEILVAEHGVVCDGVHDDTAALQAVLDAAPEGAKIVFPPTPKFCRTTDALVVPLSFTLVGAGAARSEIRRTDFYPLSGSRAGGAILFVRVSGVRIQGLYLTGAEYGNVQVRNTHGVWAVADVGKRIENITVRDSVLRKFRGDGVRLVRVDDFVVKGNVIEDVGYSGILGSDVRRGRIHANRVTDVNDPEVCTPEPNNPKACQYVNGYGIVVTGCGTSPCSQDVVVSSNVVRENEMWVGIMNHGGHRILFVDNDVADTNFLYANTVSLPENTDASHDTAFVNNVGDILPRSVGGRYDLPGPGSPAPAKGEGLWLAGWATPLTSRIEVIGNTFRNTGNANSQAGIFVNPIRDARLTWNTFETDQPVAPPLSSIKLIDRDSGEHRRLVVARNTLRSLRYGVWSASAAPVQNVLADNLLAAGEWGFYAQTGGTWDVRDNDFSSAQLGGVKGGFTPISLSETTPQPPVLAQATGGIAGLSVRWQYPTTATIPHDSFLVEARKGGGSWERLAFRPANDQKWTFDAPTNAQFERFDPLAYTATGLAPGLYKVRVRAHNGSRISGWSNVASVLVALPDIGRLFPHNPFPFEVWPCLTCPPSPAEAIQSQVHAFDSAVQPKRWATST